MLQFFSSSNGVVNSKGAVDTCLEDALGAEDTDCDLIMFYTTMGHNFEDLLERFRLRAPSARVVGCTGAGVIGREGPNESMRALSVMAIRGPRSEFAVAGIDSIVGMEPFEIGRRIAQDLQDQNPDIAMIHFSPDWLNCLPFDRVIEGIETVFGPEIVLFGSSSNDNGKHVSSFQFLDDRVFELGAVAVGFADPTLEVVVGANHGDRPIGAPLTVTRADSHRLYELDGKPPWQVLADLRGNSEPPVSTRDEKTATPVSGFLLALPEDQRKEYGSDHIVFGIAEKRADGSAVLTESIPEGAELFLVRVEDGEIFRGVEFLTARLRKLISGRKPVAVFHADCMTRGGQQFNLASKKDVIERVLGPICGDEEIPWLGLYGGGEMARLGGKNRMHYNSTALHILLRREDEAGKQREHRRANEDGRHTGEAK